MCELSGRTEIILIKKRLTALFIASLLALGILPQYANAATAYTYSQRGVISENLQLDSKIFGSTAKATGQKWAQVSPVSQFTDKKGGFAFAYQSGNSVYVVTDSGTVAIPKSYPLLGAVTADSEGNIYIVWGQKNETNDAKVETVHISKYAENGQHIKTTGFVGKVGGWFNGDSWLTKIPFDAGNCDVVIADGILMCNYAREMYNGHQSNNVVAVHISDMSPALNYTNPVPYTSHSFDQRVIYYKKAKTFVFADHGDAYPRGFAVSTFSNALEPFHFYLRNNTNYNMYVVNETFAQLGGIAETSQGLALVGASAKTLGAAAESETLNLFIQIFDPTVSKLSANSFLTVGNRSGETSTDINDNQNKPLQPITDFGVKWLTDYSNDYRVVSPQVVATDDDRLVVLWEKYRFDTGAFIDSYYMVLSSNGTVLKDITSLGGSHLNGNETPLYINGAVCWVTSDWKVSLMHKLIIVDMPSSWAMSDVNRAINLGHVPADMATNYTDNITREEFCKLVVPLYEKLKGSITTFYYFSDTSNSDVSKAAAVGLVNGVGDNLFNPNGQLTRQEAAVILSRLLSVFGKKVVVSTLKYADSVQIADWAITAVFHVSKEGIMNGVDSGNFQPMGIYTREQAIVTLLRIWDNLKK